MIRLWKQHASALTLILLAAAGCDKMAKEIFTPPIVTFRNVRIGSATFSGSTIYVELGLRNPNLYALSANHAEYKLVADDSIEVGHGQSNDSLTVGARDSAIVTLPLDLSWSEIGRAAGGVFAAGAVNYRVVGKITANTPVGARDIPLNAKGRFAPLQTRR